MILFTYHTKFDKHSFVFPIYPTITVRSYKQTFKRTNNVHKYFKYRELLFVYEYWKVNSAP